jgi:hypothetical protein
MVGIGATTRPGTGVGSPWLAGRPIDWQLRRPIAATIPRRISDPTVMTAGSDERFAVPEFIKVRYTNRSEIAKRRHTSCGEKNHHGRKC